MYGMNQVKDEITLISGISAALIWGLSPAFTRMLTEDLGAFAAGMFISLFGGIIALIKKQFTTGYENIKTVHKNYWIICATSYMLFTVTSNLAVGIARTREEVISSGIFRLLWPLMTLIMTIPINKAKVNKKFYIAVFLCFLGILITNIDNTNPSIFILMKNILMSWKACILGLFSSICWGIYSNSYSKYVHGAKEDFIGIIMIETAMIQLIGSLLFDPAISVQKEQINQLVFLVVCTFLGNVFWNLGLRGKYNLYVILFANFIPIISTVITGMILGVNITIMMLVGSLLIVVGTIWSEKCFIGRKK